MKLKTLLIAALASLAATAFIPLSAAPVSKPPQTSAVFLFGYTLKPGQREHFMAGYRRHLQWHHRHHDPLPWYGWFVSSGGRLGMFIDGTFGIPFSAFDHRIDPQGDAANASRNVLPFVKPAFRSSYVLRSDLSTGEPLEKRQPTRIIQVFYYTLRAGTAAQFESAVRAAREHLQDAPGAPAHTWYQRVEGGTQPVYMLMVARDDLASYDNHRKTLAELAGAGEARHLEAAVKRVTSEIWQYQPALSLLPDAREQ